MHNHRLRPPLRQLSAALLIAFAPTAWSATVHLSTSAALVHALTSAGHGDTIVLTGNVPLTPSDLPALQKNLTIEGNGHTLSGGGQYRGLFVDAGTTRINNLRTVDTVATGGTGGYGGTGSSADQRALTGAAGGGGAGLGGWLFVNAGAVVTINNVQFSGAAAQVGAGGDTGRRGNQRSDTHGYGGGGGMGQDGHGLVDDAIGGGGGGGGQVGGTGDSAAAVVSARPAPARWA